MKYVFGTETTFEMHPFYWWFYHIQFKIKIFMSKVPCFAKWGNLFWVLGNFVLHSILYFTIKRTYQQADFENGSFLLVSRNHFNFWQFLWNQPAVSLKPDRFWQFFWNHPAVLGGFRAKIWPKMTKSKVSNKKNWNHFETILVSQKVVCYQNAPVQRNLVFRN